jgi:hypothetical protein
MSFKERLKERLDKEDVIAPIADITKKSNNTTNTKSKIPLHNEQLVKH